MFFGFNGLTERLVSELKLRKIPLIEDASANLTVRPS